MSVEQIEERLAKDHRNHGCDTWPQHMADCEHLIAVAKAAEKTDEALRALGEADLPPGLALALVEQQKELAALNDPATWYGPDTKP